MDTCGNCRHGHHLEADQVLDPDNPGQVLCRRYPPQVFTVDGDVVQAWPVVAATDVCGEWAPELPPATPPTPAVGAPLGLRRG